MWQSCEYRSHIGGRERLPTQVTCGLRIEIHPHCYSRQPAASMTEQRAFVGERYLIPSILNPPFLVGNHVRRHGSSPWVLPSLRPGECLDPESSALNSDRYPFQRECPSPPLGNTDIISLYSTDMSYLTFTAT